MTPAVTRRDPHENALSFVVAYNAQPLERYRSDGQATPNEATDGPRKLGGGIPRRHISPIATGRDSCTWSNLPVGLPLRNRVSINATVSRRDGALERRAASTDFVGDAIPRGTRARYCDRSRNPRTDETRSTYKYALSTHGIAHTHGPMPVYQFIEQRADISLYTRATYAYKCADRICARSTSATEGLFSAAERSSRALVNPR